MKRRYSILADLHTCSFAALLVAFSTLGAWAQTPTDAQAQDMVRRVLASEYLSIHAPALLMRYRLCKRSPRLATTKWIVETRDGDVARLVAFNNQPLSPERQQLEENRLRTLLDDPALQRHRQQREAQDSGRLRKIIHALPDAFLYHYTGILTTPQGPVYRLTFQPNPDFDPVDIETQVLKAMAGELWIDVASQRVTRLQCTRIRDVEYGWGFFGKLDKGGSLLIEQQNVGWDQWRITRMVLAMSARVLFKPVSLDTTLEMSDYAPVQPEIDYRKGIRILRQLPDR